MRLTFQPTLPLRGATSSSVPSTTSSSFNPRSPCGSDSCPRSRFSRPLVSTHAPLAGSDEAPRVFRAIAPFQPTLPLRGATVELALLHSGGCVVSTHAPLAGSDAPSGLRSRTATRFNPRSPCGERHPPMRFHPLMGMVSTHAPLAGSDTAMRTSSTISSVSTHAPLAGSDRLAIDALRRGFRFQPTLPLRGATHGRAPCPAGHRFQPTLPLRGATLAKIADPSEVGFQPTLPLRGATRCP